MDTVNKPAPEKAAVTMLRLPLTVPAGHVMPGGEPIRDPFDLTVEAGIRWHPEWEGPRVTVNAYRFMHQGDAMGWSGAKLAECFGSLMPTDLTAICYEHGALVDRLPLPSLASLASLGVVSPPHQQPLSTFIARPYNATTH